MKKVVFVLLILVCLFLMKACNSESPSRNSTEYKEKNVEYKKEYKKSFLDCEERLHNKIVDTGSLGAVDRDLYQSLEFPELDFPVDCGGFYSHISDFTRISKKINQGLLLKAEIYNHIILLLFPSNFIAMKNSIYKNGYYYTIFAEEYNEIKQEVFILKSKNKFSKKQKLENKKSTEYLTMNIEELHDDKDIFDNSMKILILSLNPIVDKLIKNEMTL